MVPAVFWKSRGVLGCWVSGWRAGEVQIGRERLLARRGEGDCRVSFLPVLVEALCTHSSLSSRGRFLLGVGVADLALTLK